MIPRWLLWTLLALVSWGVWAILSRSEVIGNQLSPYQIQAASTLGLYPIMLALFLTREPVRGEGTHRRRGVWLALAAGILSSLGNVPFYAVQTSGTAEATAVVPLAAMAPLVTVVLAVPLLKERMNRIQGAGVVVSLTAIYLINVPSEEGILSPWLSGILLSIGLWGITGLLQKLSTNDLPATRSAIWFLAAFQPVALLLLLYDPLPTSMTWWTCGIATAVGFTLALGNFAVLAAFASQGKASIISPLSNLFPLVSIPIAIFAFGEQISSWRQAAGIALALVSATLLSYETTTAPSANAAAEEHSGVAP